MFDNFDFGAEVTERVSPVKLWPTEGSVVGLVDADLLPYNIAYGLDPLKVLRAQNRVESGDCQSISETPEFIDAAESMATRMNNWLEEAGCDAAIPYMTKSDSNFRLDVAFSRPYKGQRKKEKPPFFYELRDFLISHMGAVMSDGEEADDLISMEAERRNKLLEEQGIILGSPTHKEFCDFVIISSDKDSRITAGRHYDPYHMKLTFGTPIGELEPVYKDGKIKAIKGSGLRFFYAQLLMGDQIDNYTGIPRYRLQKVYELLGQLKTEQELYYAVLEAYKDKYGKGMVVENYRGTKKFYDDYMDDFGVPPPDYELWKGKKAFLTPYQLMVEQGRLAYMQKFKGDIWRANCKLPSGGCLDDWEV